MDNIIAIRDIHGCVVQLNEILLQINSRYPDHKLIFLGDYIDRGPSSEEVINTIKTIDAVFLKGNHEEMLLSRIDKEENKQRILDLSKLSNASIDWIRKKTINVFETLKYIFVHAGLDNNKKLNEQIETDYLWTIEDKDYYQITNKIVIHGHVIKEEVDIVGNRININTGCGSGGKLTAFVLPENIFLQSSESPGKEYNWEKIRKELEKDIEELEES